MALRFGKTIRLSNFFKTACGFPFTCSVKHFSSIKFDLNKIIDKPYATENAFAHKVFENDNRYSGVILTSVVKCKEVDNNFNDLLVNVDWCTLPVNEVVCQFEKISVHANVPITNPECHDLLTALRNNCNEMTDEHLIVVFKSLRYWPFTKSPNEPGFFELWNDLDKVCQSRSKNWTLRQIFLFMELWYHLHLTKKSTFVFKAAMKLLQHPHKLSKEEVVLLLFYLSLLRTATKHASMFEIESRLSEIADELTFNELSVALMGFFKADKSLFNEKLMNTVIDKLIQEIKTTSDISFTAVVKNLRKSLPVGLWSRVEEVVAAVSGEAERLSLISVTHAALLTTRPQLQHPPLLDALASKLLSNISQARLKDMEKTMFSFAQLSYDSPEVTSVQAAILEELEKPHRHEEIEAYPKTFIALIHYFCMKGVYPEKWIKKMLQEEFIHHTYGRKKYNFGRELMFVECTVDLEYPQYNGPRLEPKIRSYLAKRYSEALPNPGMKLSRHQQWHYDVIQTIEVLFGKEYVCSNYLLPHHPRADLVVHLDDKMTPLQISKCLKNNEQSFGNILRAPEPNYFAIVPASKNMFLYNSKLLNGESKVKIRQLGLIGYIPIMVPFDTWPSGSTIEKVQHLKSIIHHSKDKRNI